MRQVIMITAKDAAVVRGAAQPHSLIADNLLALRHVLNMTAIIRCGVRVARYN
jgi:hypothetical protein